MGTGRPICIAQGAWPGSQTLRFRGSHPSYRIRILLAGSTRRGCKNRFVYDTSTDSDTYAFSHPNTFAHSNTDQHPHAYTDLHSDANPDTYANSYRNTQSNPDPNPRDPDGHVSKVG